MNLTNLRSEILASLLLGFVFVSVLPATSAIAQNIVDSTRPVMAEPADRVRGGAVCYELQTDPKRTVCNYIPKNTTAANLQSRILLAIFDNRQPADPGEAYVRVVENNQLEFMSIDPKKADLITEYISRVDVLDTYVPRKFVNMNLQVIELKKNSDANVGLLLSGRYTGTRGVELKPTNRVTMENTAGIITSTFAIGNLLNSVLNIALSNFKSREEISVVSNFPFQVTHGFDLSNLAPVSQQVYRPFSIQTITEVTGVKFQGEARFHRDQPGKILLKGFTASVTQVDELDVSLPNGRTMGARTYRAGPLDLFVEPGCSTVIRVVNSTEHSKKSTRNWLSGLTDGTDDSQRDFLIVLQADGPAQASDGSPLRCGPEITAQP